MDILSSIIKFSTGNLASQGALIAAACITAVCLGFYYKNVYSYWEKRGVKGPGPWPFVGNFARMLFSNRMKLDLEWMRKYGKVYGIYEGRKPLLVVADPEVLLQICVKDFDAFPNHNVNEFSNKYQKNFLIALKDDHWKKVRALMSPTFTSGKIKRMFRFLDDCAEDLILAFKEQLPKSSSGEDDRSAIVNAKELYNLFTMDAITTCCFGIKLERAGSANLKTAATRNDFVNAAMKLFNFSVLRLLTLAIVPRTILRFVGYKMLSTNNIEPLAIRSRRLINNRKNSQKKFDDYLQLLIDARLDDKIELNEMDLAENHHAGLTHESIIADQKRMIESAQLAGKSGEVSLSDMEVLTGAIFLLAVGLETTGTLLSSCTYALAFHPEIQEKLHEEIMKIAEFNEDKTKFTFSYETITSCYYLDAVISEALRILAPVIQFDRVATRDYTIEKYNIDLVKGQRILLSYFAIMNDPDNWEKPDQFIPERFFPQNKDKIVPGSYCPFGIGPRHCLGMRFSLTEAKLALAKIVLNFRFEPAPNTSFPPQPKISVGLNTLKNPSVKIIPRNATN